MAAGVASCRTNAGWSAPPSFLWAAEAGGFRSAPEGVDLVMLVMNDKGLQHLLSSKFQLQRGRLGGSRSGGTPCFGWHRLENEC